MIANAAIFTCSICGEASSNICAYCTKDACSNHRCERCKRCSDCCECEVPLSAEEASPVEAVAESAPELAIESAQPEPSAPEPSAPEPFAQEPFSQEPFSQEPPAMEAPAPEAESSLPVFLTAAESSVFVQGSVPAESTNSPDATQPHKPFAPEHQSEPNEHEP